MGSAKARLIACSCSIPQAVCPTRAPNSRKPCWALPVLLKPICAMKRGWPCTILAMRSWAGKPLLPFTTDRQAIYEGLCVYHGGGTSLRPRDLDELRLTVPRSTPDLLLITDMQLTNLEDVIDYLAGIEGRITVVHIGENSATDRFRAATRHHPRLQIFTVLERQDIPKIVLGQVRHYLGGLQGQR